MKNVRLSEVDAVVYESIHDVSEHKQHEGRETPIGNCKYRPSQHQYGIQLCCKSKL